MEKHKCKLEDIDWGDIDISGGGSPYYPGTCRVCGRKIREVLITNHWVDAETGEEIDLV